MTKAPNVEKQRKMDRKTLDFVGLVFPIAAIQHLYVSFCLSYTAVLPERRKILLNQSIELYLKYDKNAY